MSSRDNNVNERKQFAFDLNVEPVDDGNSDFPENSDLCTICLEPLVGTNNGHPTLVTLKCNHKFHLDCIGSAFNAKSLMQCPNCKQIEPGQWRYGPNHPIQDVGDEDRIAEDEQITYSAMGMGMEWCPLGLGQCYYFNAPQCAFIEYTFTIPAAAAGAAPNFNTSEWIATRRLVHTFVPMNRRIFWSLSEPGVMRGRHYLAHPYSDHSDPYSDSSMDTAPVCPFCPRSSSVANAPVPPPYPYSSTVQPNQVPSLLGDASASVSCGYMFSSGPEQVATGMYDAGSSSSNSNQVNNNGSLAGQPFSELVEQFEIDRQTYFIRRRGDGGESGNGGGGGSGSGGGEGSDGDGGSDGGSSSDGGGGSDEQGGDGGSSSDGGGGSDGDGGGDGGSSSDGGGGGDGGSSSSDGEGSDSEMW